MRKGIALVAGIAVLVAANLSIAGLERLRTGGRVVLLELAPVDPRSLLQGDYMALRFAVETDAFGSEPAKERRDGRIVVRPDERGIGRFVRLDDGRPLAGGEIALRYRVREGRVKFATNAYFFPEGRAADFEGARYGEMRVGDSGDVLLTRMRSEDLTPLGPDPR